MLVRVKKNSVTVEGYVNVVERESEVLYDGKQPFIEKIKQGAFMRSLNRRKDVKVLLNHDIGRELASTTEGTATLKEDAVGLWCRAKIKDEEVIGLARDGKLAGWSFGFNALNDRDDWVDDNVRHRDILDLDLREVSILDDSRIPAYPANCIMTRSLDGGEEESIEYRSIGDGVEINEEAGSGGAADKSSLEDGADDSAESNYSYRNALLRAIIH